MRIIGLTPIRTVARQPAASERNGLSTPGHNEGGDCKGDNSERTVGSGIRTAYGEQEPG